MCVYRIVIPFPGVTIGMHLSCSARPRWAHLLGGFHAGKRTRRVAGARGANPPECITLFFLIELSGPAARAQGSEADVGHGRQR